MQNWVLPKKYPILPATIKNWVLPNEYPVYLLHPLKPINKAHKRHTILFPIMQAGYYPKNTQFYLQQKMGITHAIPTLSFKIYNLQNDGSILVQTPLSFNRKK